MTEILYFNDNDSPYGILSLGYSFKIDGIVYDSIARYYNVQKYLGKDITPESRRYATLIMSLEPTKAFYLGSMIFGPYGDTHTISLQDRRTLNDVVIEAQKSRVKIRGDFIYMRDHIVRKAVWAKFTQNKEAKITLLKTAEKKLISRGMDRYWNIGKDGNGFNMMGKILTEIRSLLSGIFPQIISPTFNWLIPGFAILATSPDSNNDINKHIDTIIEFDEYTRESYFIDHMLNYGFNRDFHLTWRDYNNSCAKENGKAFSKIILNKPIPDRMVKEICTLIMHSIGMHKLILISCKGENSIIAVLLGLIYGMNTTESIDSLKKIYNNIYVSPNYIGYRFIKIRRTERINYLMRDHPIQIVLTMLLRYKSILGMQDFGVPWPVAEFLYNIGFRNEGFASPLDSRFLTMPETRYWSLFYNSDSPFGSMGTFLHREMRLSEYNGHWMLTPPYVESYFDIINNKIEELMKDTKGKQLVFLLLPRPDLINSPIDTKLKENRYYIEHQILKPGTYYFHTSEREVIEPNYDVEYIILGSPDLISADNLRILRNKWRLE